MENCWYKITVLFLYFRAFYFRGTSSFEGTGPEGILGHYKLNIGVSKTCHLGESPGCLVKILISGVHILDQQNQALGRVSESGFSISIPEDSQGEKHLLEMSSV